MSDDGTSLELHLIEAIQHAASADGKASVPAAPASSMDDYHAADEPVLASVHAGERPGPRLTCSSPVMVSE